MLPRGFLLPSAVSSTDCLADISTDPNIRIETKSDKVAIRDINSAAFGTEAEMNLVDGLRAEGHARLSLVAEINDALVGHILFSTISIEGDNKEVEALALAPLAVRPEWQRRGIGTRLVEEGLEQCHRAEYRIVLVVGHQAYYRRFGFSNELAEAITSTYSAETFMALELEPDALSGVRGTAQYPQPFSQL